MKIVKQERRIDGKVKLMRVAAVLCALFAAAGIACGIHDANPDHGWLVPAFAGFVAAAGFAIAWHVMIGAVTGMVKIMTISALFIAAIIVTAISLGASAQAIATAVSGRSALSAELSAKVDMYSKALGEAHAQATSFNGVAMAAAAKAAGYDKQAETEGAGSNGTGQGCGPRCASMHDIASAFRSSHVELNNMLTEAANIRAEGEVALSMLRDAASKSDDAMFMAGAEGVNKAIAELNAIDPRPIINSTGAVVVSEKGIDLTKDTAEFQAEADKALADRHSVDGPVFVPISTGEATRKQVFGTALHGWILAGAIDILPLLLLIVAFVLSREPWHNELVNREKFTEDGQNQSDNDKLKRLMNPDNKHGDVIPFRQPAE